MKKIILVLLISVVFLAQLAFAQENKSLTWSEILLDRKGVGLLPDSPFYFLKEFRRGIKKLFTFNSVKKAELELKETDERLIEIQELAKEKPMKGKIVAVGSGKKAEEKYIELLKRALENYLQSQERLAKRLEVLAENKNAEELIKKVAERTILHQALFDELIQEANHFRIRVAEVINETDFVSRLYKPIWTVLGREEITETKEGKALLGQEQEVADWLKTVFVKLPYPAGLRELKALEVLTRIEEQLPEEARQGIATAKEAIQNKLVETGEIQQASDWQVEQGFSGYLKVGGVPLKSQPFQNVIEELEERAEVIDSLGEQADSVNLEAIKELKLRLFANWQNPFEYVGNFSFQIEVEENLLGEFKELLGLGADLPVIEYQEPEELTLFSEAERVKPITLRLRNGSLNGLELKSWYEEGMKGVSEKKTLSITVFDRTGQEVGRLLLLEAWPTRWQGERKEGENFTVEEVEITSEGGVLVGKKIGVIFAPTVCPTFSSELFQDKELCLKTARELELKYLGCRYVEICEKFEKMKACGPLMSKSTNWVCLEGEWRDLSQCGKISCSKPEPVCGSDGKTYRCGELEARACGVRVVSKGECHHPRFIGPPLPAEKSSTSSSPLFPEAPQPIFCTQEWNPVCGVDGRTYSNACLAKAAGVMIKYPGICRSSEN